MPSKWAAAAMCIVGGIVTCGTSSGQRKYVPVRNDAELQKAIAAAKPGTHILLAPGQYKGGNYYSKIHGTPGKPIVIGAANPAKPPHIIDGTYAFQFSAVSHLELHDLIIERPTGNGVNIDDGKTDGETNVEPSHHILLRNLRISDLPQGNHDGIKLSGVDHFTVYKCTVERWGGSGVDMVGCHQGQVLDCTFRTGRDKSTGVQCKGGTSNITVRGCLIENAGKRGVNIGGNTDLKLFRPPVTNMPPNRRYEAKDITVENCTIVGCEASLAFVGVDGAVARFNTLYNSTQWAVRILQETTDADFVPCRNGIFEDNLIVFRWDLWTVGRPKILPDVGFNLGDGTAKETFRFARNFWYCSDCPPKSLSVPPTLEKDRVVGQDPLLRDPQKGDFGVQPDSPALRYGAHAYQSDTPGVGRNGRPEKPRLSGHRDMWDPQ